ncbi:TetR/AcrR family transcriptional regulator [Stigmatella aurantiaca]|uniref:TetR-family transcriptional regulator n=1 Tax=Stigmatella aurantiaca (strain DW4/3-1) TaxID=378806 RepID=Q097I5_STIAD|nr:TetR/AcrR family transcriptional regulator [Stigmatella aurantiaca]ADO69886.1 Transcriptional regulator, TetR family [Stigmatella aurantiaca DW4/3-1]EAU67902.1 TetR-family transcriptional regulator [Stigmatella aurantiaca DW4/3-1]
MNQKTEQKIKSREAILASAAALLRERGITASSVSDVMKGAGLTVGGFYNHFDSKEVLFAETIRSSASTLWNKLLAGAKGDSPRERMGSVLGRYLSRTHRDNTEQGCLLPNTVPETAREGEPYLSALEAELTGFVDSLSAIMEGDAGRREKALGLIALMYGALSLARAVRGTPLSDDFLLAAKKLGERALAAE